MSPSTGQMVRAPEFPEDATWLNCSRPLSLHKDLRGHVVVLDFWTYCCINCMHVLPALARLEAQFADAPLVVVGVHSAKFISEKDPANIRRAVARYDVAHPVVVDSEHDIWQQFAVRAWPTLILIDADGYVRETLPGEVNESALQAAVRDLLAEAAAKGSLAPSPLRTSPDPEAGATLFRFPGRVHAAEEKIFVADSGHNRIVVADASSRRILAAIGEGGAGAHDGPAGQASFHNPQGMAVLGDRLYVADTGNHLIRAVNLKTLEVMTVAGTGRLGGEGLNGDPRMPRSIALRSPWGLLAAGTHLLIAMAGSHQIWAYDSADNFIGPWAGSGREDHVDGVLGEAAFAQPSGLALAGKIVCVADSEISSVRAIDLENEMVRTIVGRGLFDFGDQDGLPGDVLLQHPLDVAVGRDVLYVADTYNNKIKQIAFGSMKTITAFGDGNPEGLHEPGGLAWDGEALWIADTNNHRILRADPASMMMEEVDFRGE